MCRDALTIPMSITRPDIYIYIYIILRTFIESRRPSPGSRSAIVVDIKQLSGPLISRIDIYYPLPM